MSDQFPHLNFKCQAKLRMAFSKVTDYLRTQQYKDGSNLTARANLHRRYSTNLYGWNRWVFDHLERADLPKDAHIIECGCGPGWLWRENLHRIPSGWSILLTDFSPGMIEEARHNLGDSGRDFTFQVSDIQILPFEMHTFDAAVANHMLYHVPDRAKALSEVRRVLKPGGYFFAATNGENHMRELIETTRRFDPEFDSKREFVVGEFNLENGFDQLRRHFSEVNLSRYEDSLSVPDAEPIMAYLLSGSLKNRLNEAQIQQLEKQVIETVQEQGNLHIQKDAGLFSAR